MAKHDSGKVIQEKANVLWNVANTISGLYKPHEYGLVILPMAVVKRFHDCLMKTHDKVLAKAKELGKNAIKDAFLQKASGYSFYNTSKFTFETLVADPKNIGANFRDYLNGFSDNVRDVLEMMNFEDQVANLDKNGVLYQVVCDFNAAKAYLGPDAVATNDMGYIFENLVQRFSESYDEHAGAHFTSRDIIYLMCDLLLALYQGDKKELLKAIYDMTMGTSQMLTCMEDRLKELYPEMEVANFGQEFNPFTFAIAKADMLIRGGNPENMRFGNTLSDDKFKDFLFDFIISNPPFGIDWKKEAKSVEDEAKEGEEGRFAPGLPSKDDGQLLFLLNGIKKLKDDGRMAIIQNGSSLYTGDAGQGPSEIRKYIIEEHDWLDAIVKLPCESFYNTGLSTYIWIIAKSKPKERRGLVQLIDASHCCEKRKTPIGKKHYDITELARELVIRAYKTSLRGELKVKASNQEQLLVRSQMIRSCTFGYKKVSLVFDDFKDCENVPIICDIQKYIAKEIAPCYSAVKIDEKKIKIGYEIPFTRMFYKYLPMDGAGVLSGRIDVLKREYEDVFKASKYELISESPIDGVSRWLRSNSNLLIGLRKNAEDLIQKGRQLVKLLFQLRESVVLETVSGRNVDLFSRLGKVALQQQESWFCGCPVDWKVARIDSLYHLRKEKVSDKDYAPLSVTMRGIVPQLDNVAKTDDGDNRKLVRKGDFVINGRSDRRGSCGIAYLDGSVSTINIVLAPQSGIVPEYYDWLFHTKRFADEFYKWGRGIVDDLWTTRWTEMKRIIMPCPDVETQRMIALYLSAKTRLIKAEISKFQKEMADVEAVVSASEFMEKTNCYTVL